MGQNCVDNVMAGVSSVVYTKLTFVIIVTQSWMMFWQRAFQALMVQIPISS